MKKVIVHWVEMRTLEVPDECPTDDLTTIGNDDFEKWLFDHTTGNINIDPYCLEEFAVKSSTRDFEIVDVEAIVPENEKVGGGEDKHQR